MNHLIVVSNVRFNFVLVNTMLVLYFSMMMMMCIQAAAVATTSSVAEESMTHGILVAPTSEPISTNSSSAYNSINVSRNITKDVLSFFDSEYTSYTLEVHSAYNGIVVKVCVAGLDKSLSL